LSKWLSDAPLSEWDGVKTDDDGRVIELDLNYNYLSGEIPAELGSLSNLELGSLSNLTNLRLLSNDLSGCVPSSLEDQFTYSDLGDLSFC
jgi:hypothetical protein